MVFAGHPFCCSGIAPCVSYFLDAAKDEYIRIVENMLAFASLLGSYAGLLILKEDEFLVLTGIGETSPIACIRVKGLFC